MHQTRYVKPLVLARRAYAVVLAGAVSLGVVSLGACAANRAVGTAPAGPGPAGGPPSAGGVSVASDMQRLYRGMGLLAGTGTIPFVASVSFLRTASPDSTLVMIALSMPARALGFAREGDRYAANYNVRLELRQGAVVVRQLESKESVRVPTFRETSRTDESIIWQQFLRIAPGRYTLAVAVKDESSIRSAAEEVSVTVPRFASGALSTPVPVYEAIPRSSIDSLPRILARPRGTVTFGVDSVLPVYIEAVGSDAPTSIRTRLVGDGDQLLWDRTTDLPLRGNTRSTTLGLPVAQMGVGVATLVVTSAGRPDTVRTRVLVSLGDDLPISSFDEMFGYLRYFTTADRLKALRDATPDKRPEAWALFLRETDPVPATPEHEGLRDYFQRIRAANGRFRDDGAVGWLSDRGVAFVGLGDPDNIYDAGLNDPNQRVRQQVWEYRELRLNLVFIDQTGFGRWRLSAQAMADLQSAIRRKLSQ